MGKRIKIKGQSLLVLAMIFILGLVVPLWTSMTTTSATFDWVEASLPSLPSFPANQNKTQQLQHKYTTVSRSDEPIATVAYVVSITHCGKKVGPMVYDLATVLKKSIELNSYPLHPTSRYASKLYVLVTPETQTTVCVKRLTKIGFIPFLVDFPVKVEDIKVVEDNDANFNFRSKIRINGCCGEKELLKLHVYSMTDYKVAIHLDLDTLILRPLDPVIDAMVFPPQHPTGLAARKQLFAPQLKDGTGRFPHQRLATPTYDASVPIEEIDVHAFYTKDYNMLPRGKTKVGIQGGFIMVRPNTTTLDELAGMVRSGEYYSGADGWFRSGYGVHIWGSMTIQGLLAYYYTEVAHDTSVELNRCRFNQIAENPRRSSFDRRGKYPRGTPLSENATFGDKECRDRRSNDCDDVQCQTWPMEESFILHYTYCKAPTKCPDASWNETYKEHQCLMMMKEWFTIRKLTSVERNLPLPSGGYYPEWYQGFCLKKDEYEKLTVQ